MAGSKETPQARGATMTKRREPPAVRLIGDAPLPQREQALDRGSLRARKPLLRTIRERARGVRLHAAPR